MWLVVTGRTGVDHSMRSGTCGGSLESGLRRGICGHLELGPASRHTGVCVPVRAISLVVSAVDELATCVDGPGVAPWASTQNRSLASWGRRQQRT